ncbi:MAG: GIDE domain-containing protein [bacterium]
MTALFCSECLRAMDADDFFIWLGLAMAASVIGLYFAYRYFKRCRLIEDMPTSKVRSASQGYTELIGFAQVQDQHLSAPLTGRDCLWWRFEIEKYQSSGKSSHWVTVEKGASDTPFFFRDTTGQCRIDPKGAEINPHHRSIWYGSSRRPTKAPPIDRHSGLLSLSGMSFGRRYRYTEHLIRDGDPLYALGHFQTNKNGSRLAAIEEVSANILRHWKLDYQALLTAWDSNGDGELDVHEWQAVRKAAEKEARTQQRKVSAQAPTHSLSKPVANGLPFIIGADAQESLVRKFRHRAAGCAIGFLVAGAMATWMISSRLG